MIIIFCFRLALTFGSDVETNVDDQRGHLGDIGAEKKLFEK